jgi:hypothetical protein
MEPVFVLLNQVLWFTETTLEETMHARTLNAIARKLRRNRDLRSFDRAVRNASPSMRQELYAAASHQSFRNL